ncbi:hypothetical protein CV770_32610 [Bradyrhizobium sp. AC87j1]|nr:hypothetical protein CV770_32610 [Bradyrhizobium sp. AC87j1]
MRWTASHDVIATLTQLVGYDWIHERRPASENRTTPLQLLLQEGEVRDNSLVSQALPSLKR